MLVCKYLFSSFDVSGMRCFDAVAWSLFVENKIGTIFFHTCVVFKWFAVFFFAHTKLPRV